MKKLIAIAMLTATGAAQAENINVSAGRCGAYHYVMSENANYSRSQKEQHLQKAMLAMRHRTNIGQQQVAANNWIELARTNPQEAVKQAQWSCIYYLKIR